VARGKRVVIGQGRAAGKTRFFRCTANETAKRGGLGLGVVGPAPIKKAKGKKKSGWEHRKAANQTGIREGSGEKNNAVILRTGG